MMKEKIKNIDLLLKTESMLADAVFLECENPHESSANIFDRQVKVEYRKDMDAALAAASGGLRVSVILTNMVSTEIDKIQKARELMIPILVYAPINSQLYFNNVTSWIVSDGNSLQSISVLARKIAEESLSPNIVFYHDDLTPPEETWSKQKIGEFIGLPEDRVDCNFPSFQMIYGKRRRRIPTYFDVNSKGIVNSKKDSLLQDTAREVFFESHIYDILDSEGKRFNNHFAHEFHYTDVLIDKKLPHIVIAHSQAYLKCKAYMEWNPKVADKYNLIRFSLLNPMQDSHLMNYLAKAKSVTVLYQGRSNQNMLKRIQVVCARSFPKVNLIEGHIPVNVQDPDLQFLFDNGREKNPAEKIYPEYQFLKVASGNPKIEYREQSVAKSLDGLNKISKGKAGVAENKLFSARPSDLKYHQIDRQDFSNLSEFINNVTFDFPEQKEANHTSPYNLLNFIPDGSFKVLNREEKRKSFPEIDSQACTGCSNCVVACPYSAISAKSATLTGILNTAIEMLTLKGEKIASLKPQVKNLAKMTSSYLKSDIKSSLREVFSKGLQDLVKFKGYDNERAQEVNNEFELVIDLVEKGRWVATELMYLDFEGFQAGTGELFNLAINSQYCTECGKCAESCPEDAISLVEGLKPEKEKETYAFLEHLPPTSKETILHLLKRRDRNPFANLLMSQPVHNVLGSTINTNEEIKQLLTYFLAQLDFYATEKLGRVSAKLTELIEGLESNIHDILVEHLPDKDYSDLKSIIKGNKKPKVGLSELVESGDKVETKKLERKIDLLEDMKYLKGQIKPGSGNGRAGYGIVLSDDNSLDFLREYPVNPFNCPVYSSSSILSVMGIWDSMSKKAIENIKLLRRAALEIKDDYHPSIHNKQIISTSWENLTDEEKDLVPFPVYITTSEQVKRENEYSEILGSGIPVQLLIVDDVKELGTRKNLNRLTYWMLTSETFIYQGVLGNNHSLYKAFEKGMENKKAAVYSVGLPAAPNELVREEMANLMIKSRIMPLIHSVFNSANGRSTSLAGNPDYHSDFVHEKVESVNKVIDYPVSCADYLFRLPEFHKHFSPSDNTDGPILMDEFAGQEDPKSLPCILFDDDEGMSRFTIDEQMAGYVRGIMNNWRFLKKLSGYDQMVADHLEQKYQDKFNENLEVEKKRIEAEIKAKYEQELESRKAEIKEIVKNKLVNLSLSKRSKS